MPVDRDLGQILLTCFREEEGEEVRFQKRGCVDDHFITSIPPPGYQYLTLILDDDTLKGKPAAIA